MVVGGLGELRVAKDLNQDLARTLKTEKVTKDNSINDFLQKMRTHLDDRVSVKNVVLGNIAAGKIFLIFLLSSFLFFSP